MLDPLQIPIGKPAENVAVAAGDAIVFEVVTHGRDLVALTLTNTGSNPLTSFRLQEKYFEGDEWDDFLGNSDFDVSDNPNLEFATKDTKPHTLAGGGARCKFKVWHSGAWAVRGVARSTLGTTVKAGGNATKS